MRRQGFALLTVLWLLAALSAAGAVSLAAARLGATVTRNRTILLRGGWAREACTEILLARYAERGTVAGMDTTDLGRGTWCRVTVEDASGKLDLNRASREMLLAVLGSDSLTDALLDWRDPDAAPRQYGAEAEWYRSKGRREPRNAAITDVGELEFIRGFARAQVGVLRDLVTVRGAAQVDVNSAPAEVLRALPGLDEEAVAAVLRQRAASHLVGSADELLYLLSPSSRQALLANYQAYILHASHRASQVIVSVEGGVGASGPVSLARLTVVPASKRLAVIRRVTE